VREPNTALDMQLQRALEERGRGGIAPEVDLWPRLERTARAQLTTGTDRVAPKPVRRMLLVVAVCATIFAGGTAIAAASTPLRHFLYGTVFGLPPGVTGVARDAHGRLRAIQSLPPFTLYYPRFQPAELTSRETGRLFPPRHGVGFGEWEGDPSSRAAQAFTAPPHAGRNPGMPSLLVPFWRTPTKVVWFGFAAPDQRFIQIAEWDRAKSPVKMLTHAVVPVPNVHRPDTLLVLRKGRTTIAIETNLGPSKAHRVAASLRPLKLLGH
jgi:hypothetical protein